MIRIERVKIEDASELLEIYASYVTDTAISFEYEVPGIDEFTKRIREISAKYPYIKAVEDGKILGYAYANTFKERKAYDFNVETTIYVAKNMKRSGIGRMLYSSLEKSLKSMGVLNANACIAYLSDGRVDEHLTNDSYYFHEKMGYKLVGTFHNSGYKFGTWYDMVWMEKMLGDHENNIGEVKFGEYTIF
ncbi:GNAT family N-acetyltransferase [Butyrivibrio sp. NC3005]|uniref:GNAT family N-acetyltransferase n=1 Tax=Butyrivibrio sp. NC3005 TaxID=1280685 RepID=UPI0003FA0CFF|nr:GNAT family N-acetyltransferase [Butyrivibrio sp. NC3005]